MKKTSDKTTLRVTESLPRQVDKKPGVPEEREVYSFQGGGKDKCHFFFSTFFSLRHIKHFFFFKPRIEDYTATQFKLYTKDYITTVYPA